MKTGGATGPLPPPPLFIRYLQRFAQSEGRQSAHLLPTIFDFGFGVPQCGSVDTDRLPVPGSPVRVMDVRFLAILLVAALLPLSFSVPPVLACSTTDCCGANCSPSAPVSHVELLQSSDCTGQSRPSSTRRAPFRFGGDDARSRYKSRDLALAEYRRRSWVLATRVSRFVSPSLFPSDLNLPYCA